MSMKKAQEGAVEPIVVSAVIERVSVDREGEAKITFTVPQDDAAKMAVLAVMTQTPLKLTIEQQEAKTHGRRG